MSRNLTGADEQTPSRSQYFSWINNTNEGSTEEQTRINLEFFRWLHDEFGMVLDIYAWDAGHIDGRLFYGSTDSDRFRRQFPNGMKPLYELAKEMDCRLGVWVGPDGFGDTPEEEAERSDMMVALCRDYDFALFKMDAVCGQLRPEKHEAFAAMMKECRRHSPDLILLNHRLDLGEGLKYATTFLWDGVETYIDVHMANRDAAPHNRACALSRGLVPDLQRLAEDHGVCLSSCLDFWEDDLVLQAFNRCLILAPEIYGNPWLLRDDEFPKLARIYNLHRRYRDILVDGARLPESYGPFAVTRGDDHTRLLTLRNLTWHAVRYTVLLNEEIGLEPGEKPIEVRRFHPSEEILGRHEVGASVEIEVLPFRSCLILATSQPCDELGVDGCSYEVVRDVPGKPAILKLLGEPGSSVEVNVHTGERPVQTATVDGAEINLNAPLKIEFPGVPQRLPWHRKLSDLARCDVPDDAEALYEATCFAADNNALEARSVERSGESEIPEVRAARDAFFEQSLFVERGIWDRNLFDGRTDTAFQMNRRWRRRTGDFRIRGGAWRIDFGREIEIDRLVMRIGGEYFMQPMKREEAAWADVSNDLREWQRVRFMSDDDLFADLRLDGPVRYLRLTTGPDRVTAIEATCKGQPISTEGWRASNLFAPYNSAPAIAAFSASVTIEEVRPGSYLAVPIHGEHGVELACAALRVGDRYVGAPDRAPSYPSNSWECPVRESRGNYTYLFPLDSEMEGQTADVVVLVLRDGGTMLKPEVWQTAYPIPFAERELILE